MNFEVSYLRAFPFLIVVSAHLLALLAHAERHALCLGAQPDQPRDAHHWRLSGRLGCLRRLLDRHVDEAVLLELALRVEVGDEEASLLVCLRNLRHQLDVELLGEVLHVLLEVQNRCVNLHLVLPVVVCPFLLEFEVRASCGHEGIDEVDLDLVDVDDVRDVAARRVEGQVAIDRSVVG